MAAIRTEITEIITGLAMLGAESLDSALSESVPAELLNVDHATWFRLRDAHRDRENEADFLAAWNNGRAFLNADDGLRGRLPLQVEWKGPHRDPGDVAAPADLRIDHVYLVSCKYLSKVLHNASPSAIFERNLVGAQGRRSDHDWFDVVAAAEHQQLYQIVRRVIGEDLDLPESVRLLTKEQRQSLRLRIPADWGSDAAVAAYQRLVDTTAAASAELWSRQLTSGRARALTLWRLLRLAPAPYFVLGTSAAGTTRLRVGTPWDFNRSYKLTGFEISHQPGGQARVGWRARVYEIRSGREREVLGHVEIRWSHGRFGGPPEAKVYLDSVPGSVPGYWPLT
ncbi:MAG: hypothetical protein WBF71_07715 [Microthrixaceae bacterium]